MIAIVAEHGRYNIKTTIYEIPIGIFALINTWKASVDPNNVIMLLNAISLAGKAVINDKVIFHPSGLPTNPKLVFAPKGYIK
jgi:hypothetical protein